METFLISDTHFGHANLLKFKRDDGSPVRDFSSVEEMNEYMVTQWNSLVKPNDLVYHLGDVVMNPRQLKIMYRLNGRKRLVRGNHDLKPEEEFRSIFEQILGVKEMNKMLLSHFPVHPSCLNRYAANIHGHTHFRTVKKMHGNIPTGHDDPRYINVSVEMNDYAPISFEKVREIAKSRGLFD